MIRERIEGAIMVCALAMVVIVAIAMIAFPPPPIEPEPQALTDRLGEVLDAADFDWDICFGDCCVSAEAFEEFLWEQCEGEGAEVTSSQDGTGALVPLEPGDYNLMGGGDWIYTDGRGNIVESPPVGCISGSLNAACCRRNPGAFGCD